MSHRNRFGIALLGAWLLLGQIQPAAAQSLVGTWDFKDGTSAKCKALLTDGVRASSEYGMGPLEISQSGSEIYVRSAGRPLHYQGLASFSSASAGSAVATSCDAETAVAFDVPGTFYLARADATKGSLRGIFVGRWQNSNDILICKIAVTRTSGADPGIAACP